MRRIENWLLLPIIILFCWSIAAAPSNTFDIHLHDTYFVVDGVSRLRFPAYALLIIFGMYKTIRNRHQNINQVFAVSHIFITVCITVLLTVFLVIPSASETRFVEYSNWTSNPYRSLPWQVIAIISYLLVQVIFGIYFVVQLLRKPVPGGT